MKHHTYFLSEIISLFFQKKNLPMLLLTENTMRTSGKKNIHHIYIYVIIRSNDYIIIERSFHLNESKEKKKRE